MQKLSVLKLVPLLLCILVSSQSFGAEASSPAVGDILKTAAQEASANDASQCKQALSQAAPLVKDGSQAYQWSHTAWQCASNAATPAEAGSMVASFSSMASSDLLKKDLAMAMIDGARYLMRGSSFKKGIVIFNEAKKIAAGMDDLAPAIAITDKIAAGHQLADAGKIDDAIAVFSQAQSLAGDNAKQTSDVLYCAALVHAYRQARARNLANVDKLADFMTQEAAANAGTVRLHSDLANVRHNAGQSNLARAEVLAGAKAAQNDKDWTLLTSPIYTVIAYSSPSSVGMSLADQLAPLATTDAAKAALAKAYLRAAERYLPLSEYENGLQLIAKAKEFNVESEDIALLASVVDKLAEARELAQSKDYAGSVDALNAASSVASGNDEMNWRIRDLSVQLMKQFAYAKNKPAAEAYVALLQSKPELAGKWNVVSQMVEAKALVKDAAGAEKQLMDILPLVTDEGRSRGWAGMAVQTIQAAPDTERAATFGRIMAAAPNETAKQGIVERFIDEPLNLFARGKFVAAKQAYSAVKPFIDPTAQNTKRDFTQDLMAATDSALAGDGAAATTALQNAHALANDQGKSGWKRDLFNGSLWLAHARIHAGDKATASKLADFLGQTCATDVNAWDFHRGMSELRFDLRDFAAADDQLAAAAAGIKTAGQAGSWADMTWLGATYGQPVDGVISALKQFEQAAPNADAKAKLAKRALRGAREWLASRDYAKGCKILPTVKAIAAASPELQPMVQFVDHLDKAYARCDAMDTAGSIAELKAAQAAASNAPGLMKSIYGAAYQQALRRSQDGDRIVCDGYINFIQKNFGKIITPFKMHHDQAFVRAWLKDGKPAREQIIEAAAAAGSDDEWWQIEWPLEQVVVYTAPAKANFDMLDMLEAMAKTDRQRRLVGLTRVKLQVHLMDAAGAEKVLDSILPQDGTITPRLIRAAYSISSCYACLNNITDAYRLFAKAEQMAAAITFEHRESCLRGVFYGWNGKRVPYNLHVLLKMALDEAKDQTAKNRLLALYIEAAGANSAADEGVETLQQMNAGAAEYVKLVRQLLDHSDVKGARTVANGIPVSLLEAEPEAIMTLQKILPGLNK